MMTVQYNTAMVNDDEGEGGEDQETEDCVMATQQFYLRQDNFQLSWTLYHPCDQEDDNKHR